MTTSENLTDPKGNCFQAREKMILMNVPFCRTNTISFPRTVRTIFVSSYYFIFLFKSLLLSLEKLLPLIFFPLIFVIFSSLELSKDFRELSLLVNVESLFFVLLIFLEIFPQFDRNQ